MRLRRLRIRAVFSVVASAAVVAATFAILPATAAQAADGDPGDAGLLRFSKTGDTSVLVGQPISYELTATNSGSTAADDEYNLSVRDVLPVGVSYKQTTAPKGLGDPTIVTLHTDPLDDTSPTYQVLIWRNVSDLPAGATQRIDFDVTVDADTYPVGSTVANTADAYAQNNPRAVPKFDANGDPKSGSYTDTESSAEFDTAISALTIDKTEPSPEHELMRGVHDDTTTYTLKVTNNGHAATNGNTVTDYLPAGLEFLGCGGVDNGSTHEYGDVDLTTTPTIGAGSCMTPLSVETVNSDLPIGLAPGVYTKVTWSLPDLGDNDTWTTTYAAGIPQRANTMDFGATTPSPASGEQGANLDNNTGASTRENASSSGTQDGEQGLTNLAQVSGSYTGAIQGAPTDKTVFDSDSTTVTAEDLAMQKQVDTDTGTPGDQKTFTQGGTAQYTLHVETGEYADASGVTVTDVIPDGLCPLKAGTTDTCATSASDFTATGAQVDSITQNPDHTWTVVFKPFDQAAQKVQTITYTALMGATYAGHDQDPTVSGDDYTNSASLVGTTTSLAGVDPPASDQVQIADVRDASSATIVSGGPTLSKTMMEQATPYTCDKADGTYTDNTTTAKDSDALTFRVGDRVCFDISVNFSAGNSTRNPVVTDFLPDYVTYEAGSAVAVSPADNVAAVLDDSDATSGAGGRVQWAVGTAQGGGDRFVAKGGVFEWRLSAIVTSEPDAAPKPDITANLAKLTWVDTAGTVGFLRDQVDFSAGATPPIAIEKSHDGSSTVVGGSVVPYTIVVTNKGDDDDHDNVPVKNVVVRDDLPTGISCSDVTSAPAAKTTGTDLPVSGYTCDPGTGVMQWTLAGPLAAGASSAIAYSVTIPGEPGARTAFKNVTGVVSYDTDSNRGTTTTHYPSDNIDPTVCDATGKPDCDVPAATDDDTVTVKDVSISKAQTTAIDEAGNNAASQAVIGEEITYTVTGTIPAHTTVYDGTVSDTLPAGIKLTDAHPSFDAGAPDVLPSPVGFSANYLTGSASIDLTGQYVNDTAQDQTFTLTLTGQVTTASANVNDTALKNTAKFTYKSSDTSSTYTHTASKTATVVEPSPSLTKTHTPVGAVASGDTLTYTLKAANAAGRPTLYDSYVIDCIPAGLTFGSATAPSGTSVDTPLVAGTGAAPAGNGCAVGTEVLRWHIGAIAGGANVSLPYTVTVDPGSVGGQVYTNSATLIGSDLDDGVEDPTAIERSYSDTDQDSATVAGSTLTKASSTPLLAIGDVASFTVTATVPANVNYFDATVTDVLPSGVDATAVSTVSTACSYPDNSPCSIAPTGLTPSSQTIGWFLGDLIADAKARTVTITYTAPVVATSATAPKAGDALTNRAVLGWNNTNGTDPTTVGGTPDHTAGPATSTDHVTEPSVSIAKTVSDATPDPGQSFTYTVKATNGSGTYVSAAHQVVVTDAVPTGVVVDASTISDGGTISGADPQSGGGTITWTLSSLAKGATAQVTYKARLQSPSPSTALTNTATVAGYCSVTVPAGSTCADAGGRTYPGTKPTAHATVTPALPHVVVSKTADGGDVAYLGTSKHFTVTITSDGASKAYNIGAVDTLPDNWTYDANSARVSVVGAAASAVEPSVSGQTLTWTNLGDLPAAGDTIVITYSATPDNPQAATDPGVGHTTDHTNSVAVTAQDADGQTQDAAHSPFNGPGASATTHIDSADVTITKSADDNPVAGNDHSWTLTVGNDGPDTAVGPFTVSDDVPAPLTGVSAQGQGWTCTVTATGGSADARHVSCSRTSAGDTLAKGASFPTITVAGHIPATTAPDTDVANTATVDGISTYDPDEPGGHNDTSTTPGTTTLIADLGVTKTLTNAPIVAGGTATYNVVVKNNGPSMYYGSFVVTDPVPAGTTFKSVQVDNPAQWQCTTPQVGGTGQVVCTWGADGTPPASGTTLAAGDSRSVTISVDVDPGRTADITNTATVTSAAYDHDPNPANDTSSVGAPTLTSADLAITKTASDTSVVAGTDTTYTLAVKNRGPSDASDVTVTDTLPSGFSFDSLDGSVTDWSCVSDHAAPETLTCTLTAGGGTLGSGDSAQPIVLHATVSAGHGAEKDVANTASVDSDTPDPDPSNNDSTATLDVTRSADVSLTKTHSGNGLHGSVVDFTLTARNAGPSTAESVRVVDTLPSGLTYVSVSGTDWTCSYSAPDLTCDYVGPLAPDSAAPAISVNTTVTAAQFTSATNTAVVSTSTPGDDPSNNEATDTVVVSDVGLTKTTSTDTRAIGQRADYTLTVTLPAQVNLYNLVLTDTLPDGIDPASVQIEGTPGCELGDHTACNATATPLTSDGQTVGWGLGDLPKVSGSQAKRIITLTYSAIVEDVPGNTDTTGLVNAASAGWDFSDRPKPTKVTDPHDSQTMPSTATVTVVEPKLTIDKTVNDTAKITAKPGQRFDYEVTLTNTGDAPAYDATVTDKVPAGIQVVGGTVSDGGTLSGDTITWTIPGPIEPGASKALTLTYGAKLASPAPDGAQTNTATIDSYHSTAADGDADRSYTDAPTASAEVDPLLPHVSIAKSVLDNGTPSEDALAYIGEPVTWRVTATNDTDVATHDVTITDTLPPNWSYVPGSAQVSVLGGATSQVEPTVSGQTLTWTDLGDLPSKNDAIVVDYAAKPGAGVVTSPGVGSGIDHVNTAAVTAEDDEGRTGTSTTPYNGAPDTAEVHIDSADLELVKVPQDAPAVAGSPFTWTLTVTNHGGDTAVGPFTVTDTMPAEMEGPFSASGHGWTCSGSTTITCSHPGTLADGSSLDPITVTGTIPAGTSADHTLTNTATVGARTYDPTPGNNTDSSSARVGVSADLSMRKNLEGALVAGQVATYTLDVTNNGPSVHHGTLTVTDPVPDGTTFVSASGEDWSCAEPGGTITCTHDAAVHPVGAVGQIIVRVKVDADRTDPVVNTATVTGDGPTGSPDPDPTNDSDTVSTDPGQSADVSINKESLNRPFISGTQGTYRFTVHNAGPSVARNVTVTDTLPDDTTFASADSKAGTWHCVAPGGTVTCSLDGTLAVGDDAVVEVTVDVDPAHTGDLENSATVHTDTPDPVSENNTDTDHTDGRAESDLSLVKSQIDPSGAVTAGERVTYRLTVTNNGPSVSHAPITVTDHLPDGMSCVTIAGSGCSGSTGTFTRHQDLAKGATFSVDVVAAVAPSAGPATLVNNAVVDAPEESDPTNNADSVSTSVTDRTEIRLTKSVDDADVDAGDTRTFTMTVTNDGPSDADDVVISDSLPAGMSLVGDEISGPGWSCDASTASCTLPTLAAGTSSSVHATVLIDPGTADGTTLTNSASVTTATPGDDPADDTDTASVTAHRSADLHLRKTHDGSTVAAGVPTSYTIDVGNAGPSDADGPLTVVDTLPSGFDFLSASAPWECTPAGTGSTVTCTVPDGLLAGQDAAPLVMQVLPEADVDAGDYTNSASVTSPTADPNTTDNTDSVGVTVGRSADVSVTKVHRGTPVVGENLDYVLSVRNDGPATARDVVVTDPLPAGLRFVSASGAGWSCAGAATVRCSLDKPLSPGAAAADITVTVMVGRRAYPEIANTATVSSSTTDPDPGDNASTDTAEVPAQVDLSVVKHHRGRLEVGHRATYTIAVHNSGPTEAPDGATVTDTLPKGLRFVSASAPGWTCTAKGRRVSCTVPSLAAGARGTITVVVDVLSAAYPSVVNSAGVHTDSADTDPTNNTSTDIAKVHADASGTGSGDGSGDGSGGGAHASGLPGTGGPAAWLLGLAVALLGGGLVLTRRRVRE